MFSQVSEMTDVCRYVSCLYNIESYSWLLRFVQHVQEGPGAIFLTLVDTPAWRSEGQAPEGSIRLKETVSECFHELLNELQIIVSFRLLARLARCIPIYFIQIIII